MNPAINSNQDERIRWWQTSRAADLLSAAALAFVLCLLLHESLFTGKGLVPADAVLNTAPWNLEHRPGNMLLGDQYATFLPQKEFVYQRIREKDFPLWNPYLGCGMPNFASIQGALIFPINLLLLPLDPFSGSGLAAFLKLYLAGLFTWLYLRLLGVSRVGAWMSAMVFSLCGFMIVWLGHPQVNSAMWLPLLLYFVEQTFRREDPAGSTRNLRSWAGFSLAFAFMILGGHPPTVVHVMMGVTAYFVFRLADHRKQPPLARAGLFIGAIVTGLLLSAPQLLPYLEYYRESSSPVSSAMLQRWSTHLTPNTLIYFLLPHISGNPASGFEYLGGLLGQGSIVNFNERTAYIGIVPLFLAVCAMCCRPCRFTRFFFGMAVVSGLIVYGVLPFPWLLKMVPVLQDINHSRLLLLIAFSLAVMAGCGWDAWQRVQSKDVKWRVAIGFFLVVGVAAGWSLALIGSEFEVLTRAARVFVSGQFLMAAGGLMVILLLTIWNFRWKASLLAAVCLTWTATDLLWFGRGYNPAISRADYYPSTPALERLAGNTSAYRVFGLGTVLLPNTAQVFGISDVRGCDFMTVRRYEELISGQPGEFFFYRRADRFPPSFPLLNARYVLAATPLPLNPALFEPVYSGEMIVYEYKSAVNRALLVYDYHVEAPAAVLAHVRSGVFNPEKGVLLEKEPHWPNTKEMPEIQPDVRVVMHEPDEVRMEAELPRPGFLVLLDTYFPGWTATVNGRKTEIYRANYNFRAVALPAGNSSVRFSYEPGSLRVGIGLAGAGLLLLVLACCRRRQDSVPEKTPDRAAPASSGES